MIIEDLRVYHTTIELNNASRAGAQYAIHSPANASNLQDMEQAALNDGPGYKRDNGCRVGTLRMLRQLLRFVRDRGRMSAMCARDALLTFLHSLRLVAPTAHSCGLSNNLSHWSGLW
jgi:hypothetical protein